LGRSDYIGIADSLKTAAPLATEDAQKKTLEELKSRVLDSSQKAISDAEASYNSKDYLPALKTCLSLSEAFPATPLGKSARSKLTEAQKDKDAAKMIPEAEASVTMIQVTTLIQDCRKAGKAGEDQEVICQMPAADKAKTGKLLSSLVKNYGKTDTGQEAKALLEEVRELEKVKAKPTP
jgi:hypothetical protein